MKQQDFMPSMVEIGRPKLVKTLKSAYEIIVHGVLPHQSPKNPKRSFESGHISDRDADMLMQIAEKFYDEASKRIETLEEKGFKLLTYISAVSALLVYFLSTNATGLYRIIIILTLMFLALAILISLRCIGVKSQKALYIDAIFTFDNDDAVSPTSRNKKEITSSLINCAVFNHNVADNTADILRAARIMLSIGIIGTVITCAFYLNVKEKPKEVTQTIVTVSDSTMHSWTYPLTKIEEALKQISDNTKDLVNQPKQNDHRRQNKQYPQSH